MFIFYKSIDQSVLSAGFTIPVMYKDQLSSEMGFSLERGQKKVIQILIENASYSAIITNIQFDESKYPNHGDVLQIRYGKNSPLAQKLREIFQYTGNLINQSESLYGTKRLSNLHEKEKEFIAIYSTPNPGTIMFDCIQNSEFCEESSALVTLGETLAEGIMDGTDESAGIILKTKICKIRKLTKAIGNDLKIAYGYRCQICGRYIGEPYGSHIIHAHHIDYFTRSMNNNANNIMIVCPNHHAVIHDQNPVFDFKRKEFHYPNGYVEKLKLNIHL